MLDDFGLKAFALQNGGEQHQISNSGLFFAITKYSQFCIGIYQPSVQWVICRSKANGASFAIYEPTLPTGSSFYNSKVIGDLNEFKSMCDAIVANRVDDSLSDVMEKVYTRDLFGRD